jgi:hypothetical protein
MTMDQTLKPSTDSPLLTELEHAIAQADRCIELSRRERGRIETAGQALAGAGIQAEHQVLEHAREKREQREALELRAEWSLPPMLLEGVVPPLAQQPAAELLPEEPVAVPAA